MRERKTKPQRIAVLLCCVLLLGMSFGVTAQYSEKQILERIIQPTTLDFTGVWLYYDLGETGEGVGLTTGGTFESAIRLTPEELGQYDAWDLTVVRFYHSGESIHQGIIKIYQEGTQNHPGDLIYSQPYTAIDKDWVDIVLEHPVSMSGTQDIWVGVEISHQQGEYPMGLDMGPAVSGKGCFIYFMDEWFEMTDFGIDANWNIRVFADDVSPPITYCELTGYMQGDIYVSDVSVELIASDYASGVNYTMYRLNEEEWNLYIESFVVFDDGEYLVEFYSVDYAGNVEDIQRKSFIINTQGYGTIEIELVGRIGVTAFLFNNGSITMYNVAWSIDFEGGALLYGGDSNGVVDIAPYGEVLISTRLILGFGRTTITITAGEQSLQQKALLLGPFVLYR